MSQLSTAEQLHSHTETFDKERVAYLGRLAIKSEFLGINDPLTHLHQYLIKGEEALVGIKEDIETDIAERLPKTPFVNHVDFQFTGDDFVSLKDKVSMKLMTEKNLQIFNDESIKNPYLIDEFERAEIEAQEVMKLSNWFKTAQIGSYLIFESLPIGDQRFAISRIYQKSSDKQLDGCFVSLYNSSVNQFNKLRKEINHNILDCQTEKEILQNPYEFLNTKLDTTDKFVDFYVGVYDHLLQEGDAKQYSFGIEGDNGKKIQNGLLKVRNQPKLTSIYIETVKILASGQGRATPELIKINDSLGINYPLEENQPISIEMAHNIMNQVILGITSVIDRADEKLLIELEASDISQEANYSAIYHYGEQAKVMGETYTSNGCPEYSRTSTSTESNSETNNEYNLMYRAFNTLEKKDNFGKPKIGICRIPNCPSRGKLSWMPDKTLVGGCDICVCCHNLFGKGKSPKKIYNDRELQKQRFKKH